MESVQDILKRSLPKTVSNAGLMTQLAAIRDELRPKFPNGTSIELQEWMGIVSVSIRLPGVSQPETATIKVVAS